MVQILIKCVAVAKAVYPDPPAPQEISNFKKQNGELDSVGYCVLCNFCLSVP